RHPPRHSRPAGSRAGVRIGGGQNRLSKLGQRFQVSESNRSAHGVRRSTSSGCGTGARREVMRKTNVDRYLAEQSRDPAFAERFQQAGEAWDVALQIAALRVRAGLTQKELAHRLK